MRLFGRSNKDQPVQVNPAHEDVNLSAERIFFRAQLRGLAGYGDNFVDQLLGIAKNGSRDTDGDIKVAFSTVMVNTVDSAELNCARNAITLYRARYGNKHAAQGVEVEKIDPTKNIAKIYFGAKNIVRKSAFEIPKALSKEAHVIKGNGHNFFEVLDHLLIYYSMRSSRAGWAVAELFPPKDGIFADYAKALSRVLDYFLKNSDSRTLEILEESSKFVSTILASRACGMYNKSIHGRLEQAPKGMLVYEPGLSFASVIPRLGKSPVITVVAQDPWEAFIIHSLSSSYQGIRIQDQDFLKRSPEQAIKAMHFNLDRPLPKAEDLEKFFAQVPVGGQVVFSLASSAENRKAATEYKLLKIFRMLVEEYGFIAELSTGKMAAKEDKHYASPMFYPASIHQRDFLTFTKKATTEPETALAELAKHILLLKTLSLFANPKFWKQIRDWCEPAYLIEDQEAASTIWAAASSFGLSLRKLGAKVDPSRLFVEGRYEELANEVIKHDIFRLNNQQIFEKKRIKNRPKEK